MKWKTKNGDVLDVKDMSDSHIKSCIELLARWSNPGVLPQLSGDINDDATWHLANQATNMYLKRIEKSRKAKLLMKGLSDELKRRHNIIQTYNNKYE